MRVLDQELLLEQAAPATPAAGQLAVYAATDHSLHAKDSNGVDVVIGLVSFATQSKWA